jgi:hypothetical protein
VALRDARAWTTNRKIANKTAGVSERTVRAHTKKLVRLGIAEQWETFGGYFYRLRSQLDEAAIIVRDRLDEAVLITTAHDSAINN